MTEEEEPLVRGSNAYQREQCNGSGWMEKGMPQIVTKEQVQGNRLHDYSNHTEYDRRLLPPEEQDLLRTADQLEAQALDTIGLSGAYSEQREIKLGNEFIGGHPDLLRVYGDEISVILDRKFGWAPVERADTNLQLRVYAILAPSPDVYVGILQPRAAYADRITLAKYNADTKAAARNQIAKIVEACEDPDAPLKAGEWCRYCRARMVCPALREAVTKELVPFTEISPELSKRALSAQIELKLAKATDKQLGELYGAVKLAGIVNDPLGDEIRRRIAAGGMDGYTVGTEYDVRKIGNPREAVSRLKLSGILERGESLELCDLPIGRVETKYREKTGVTAKQATADINKALEGVIEKDPRKGRILKK